MSWPWHRPGEPTPEVTTPGVVGGGRRVTCTRARAFFLLRKLRSAFVVNSDNGADVPEANGRRSAVELEEELVANFERLANAPPWSPHERRVPRSSYPGDW